MLRAWMRILAVLSLCGRLSAADLLSPEVGQLLVSIAPEWKSTRGTLWCVERDLPEVRSSKPAGAWRVVGAPIDVLYGRSGLAWGIGIAGQREKGRQKREGDGRAPAGIFALGTIYGYDAALPDGATFPYHRVTAADAWVDDSKLPEYNRHVQLADIENAPPWFEKHRMRLGDAAYRWMIEVRHNSDPPVPGAGSAIFLHVRRGPDRVTAGCTVMAEPDLQRIILWLRPESRPHFVLLPRSEYERLAPHRHLPPFTLFQSPSTSVALSQ